MGKKTSIFLIICIFAGSCIFIYAYLDMVQPQPINPTIFSIWWILFGYTPGAGHWIWVSGYSDSTTWLGNYGKKGVATASNVPGSRLDSISWIDLDDRLWLFGGWGYNNITGVGFLNDLWMFNITSGCWTWMSGNYSLDQSGYYGTKGLASASNVPGARFESISWIDSNDNLWLFGGWGYNNGTSSNRLNDLWKFNTTTLEWTWVSGNYTLNERGSYGSKGMANPNNVPGARENSISWIDSDDILWLFGGYGWDNASVGYLNDLWKFNTTTLEWTWVSGANIRNQLGYYGTKGVPGPSNVPGARRESISWIDSKDALWLFGGWGYNDVTGGHNNHLNDLWKFNTTTLEWTWVSGTPLINQTGTYGKKGVATTSNVPGARRDSISWIDSNDILWLFGGEGYNNLTGGFDEWLNDLWNFNITTLEWTWMSGNYSLNNVGKYGMKGWPIAGNVPGARDSSISWIDSYDNLWLFGGHGYNKWNLAWLNDLWKYTN